MEDDRKAIIRIWLESVRSVLPAGGADPTWVAARSAGIDDTQAATAVAAIVESRRLAAAGAGGALPWYGDPTMLLRGLASEVLGRARLGFDEDFDRAWDELLEFVRSDESESLVISSVVGLWLSQPKVTFDPDGLYLEQLPEPLAQERWAGAQAFADGHALGFFLPYVSHPWDPFPENRHEADASGRLARDVERAWMALALVAPTHPAFPLPYTEYTTSMGRSWLERPAGRAMFPYGRGAMMALPADAARENDWVMAYRALDQIWDRFTFLDLALRRFVEGTRKVRYDDRLIDFSIAAESLFLVGMEVELSNRLSQRAAVWLGGQPEQRDQHWADFREIYAARSKLVHGEQWRPKPSQRELRVLAGVAGELLRQSLRRAVDWCAAGHCLEPAKGLLDWDQAFRHSLNVQIPTGVFGDDADAALGGPSG